MRSELEKERKNPRIPPWKVWIVILSSVQLIAAIQIYWIQHQNAQSHQLLWDSVIRQSEIVNEHIEGMNQYLEERIHLEKGLQEDLRQLLGSD